MGTCNQKHRHCFIFKRVIDVKWYEADRDHLLRYESVPVFLDEVPCKQVAGEAFAHSVDDQRQLLSPDDVALQTRI